MAFTHSTLQRDGLRLIQPMSTTQKSLHFRLVQFQRRIAPPYTAVSYTWGKELPTETIYLDGQAFHVLVRNEVGWLLSPVGAPASTHVTPNLWSCLYYLSLDKRNQGWDYLWVDAICIDQNNDLERNSQVRAMDAIYRDANCASVWLGLVPFPEEYRASFERWHEPIMMFDSDGFDWTDSIDDLANRPYWSRFWVIQEFLLAKHVYLYCSGNRIDWLGFSDILEYRTGISLLSDSYDAIHKSTKQSLAALPLVMGRHPDRFPELSQPLFDLLINHGGSLCKEPRDRVFALLGLIPIEERSMLERYFPDYTLSEDNVVIIALGHLMVFSDGRDILDTEEIFVNLGVRSVSRRKKLLRRLDHFDYIGNDGNTTYLRQLELESESGWIEGENLDESNDAASTKLLGFTYLHTRGW